VDATEKWVEQPSLVPLLTILSESEKPKFRDYVVKRMIDETLQDDGTCFETFRRINVRARKYFRATWTFPKSKRPGSRVHETGTLGIRRG
jgi:hypothetical protein